MSRHLYRNPNGPLLRDPTSGHFINAPPPLRLTFTGHYTWGAIYESGVGVVVPAFVFANQSLVIPWVVGTGYLYTDTGPDDQQISIRVRAGTSGVTWVTYIDIEHEFSPDPLPGGFFQPHSSIRSTLAHDPVKLWVTHTTVSSVYSRINDDTLKYTQNWHSRSISASATISPP